MIMGGQLDGLLSHWQPAFANELMMMNAGVLEIYSWSSHLVSRLN